MKGLDIDDESDSDSEPRKKKHKSEKKSRKEKKSKKEKKKVRSFLSFTILPSSRISVSSCYLSQDSLQKEKKAKKERVEEDEWVEVTSEMRDEEAKQAQAEQQVTNPTLSIRVLSQF